MPDDYRLVTRGWRRLVHACTGRRLFGTLHCVRRVAQVAGGYVLVILIMAAPALELPHGTAVRVPDRAPILLASSPRVESSAGDHHPVAWRVTSSGFTWGPDIPLPSCPVSVGPLAAGFDFCLFASQSLIAIYGFVTEVIAVYMGQSIILPLVDPSDPNSNFLLGTPPAFTYAAPGIQLLYFDVALPIALGLVALIVALGGISLMVRPQLGLSYHTMVEFLPRLLLGAGLSVFGLARIAGATQVQTQPTGWISGLVQLTNALDQAIPTPVITANPNIWPDLANHPTAAGILFAAFAAGSTILLLLILWQLLVRVAVIDVLIVTAPLAMICWVLPLTQRWTELWTRTFVGMLLVQPVQLLALNVGVYLSLTAVFHPVDPTPLSLILQAALQVAVLFVVARLPRLMQSAPAFEGTIVSLSNLYFAARAAISAGSAGVSRLSALTGP
jgi:hypothetical protein